MDDTVRDLGVEIQPSHMEQKFEYLMENCLEQKLTNLIEKLVEEKLKDLIDKQKEKLIQWKNQTENSIENNFLTCLLAIFTQGLVVLCIRYLLPYMKRWWCQKQSGTFCTSSNKNVM